MICFPNAKINLGLNILSKRDDGFHNISSCFIPIPLFDALEIKKSKRFVVSFYGNKRDIDPRNNTITKAWNIVNQDIENLQPVEVNIYKNIPLGSGLGGGSSNASFFLILLNRYLNLNISNTRLMYLSGKVGADCPFFLINRPSLVSGIGEIIKPHNIRISGMHLTLIYPSIEISTEASYSSIKPSGISDLEKSSHNPENWRETIKNDFEEVVFKDHPDLEKIKLLLYDSGAFYASLTGSGSSIYALSNNELILNNELLVYKHFKYIL